MRKVILKINPQTNLIEDIGESYTDIPVGYTEVEVFKTPYDLMCGCYRYENGMFTVDDALYEEYLKAQQIGITEEL